MAHDVFISYSSRDKSVADATCCVLEARGVRCWIAPRDVVPGQPYGEAIVDGIGGARVMVLVFSSHANASTHVAKEVERAVSKGLTLVPLRIEEVVPGKSLDYFIASVHWLDAMTPPLEQHLERLAADLARMLARSASGAASSAHEDEETIRTPVHVAGAPAPEMPRAHASAAGYWVAGVLAAVAALFAYVLWRGAAEPGANRSIASISSTAPHPADSSMAPGAGTRGTVAIPRARPDLDGCWQWFTGAVLRFNRDGSVTAPPFTARWREGDRANVVNITWPEPIDEVGLSADGRALKGGNQYGFAVDGKRLSGRGGIEGSWLWANGVTVNFSGDGTGSAGPFTFSWMSDAPRAYRITWPVAVDTLTLSPGAERLDGSNQYGVRITGAKMQRCP